MVTVRAIQRIITEGEEDGCSPLSEVPVYHVLFFFRFYSIRCPFFPVIMMIREPFRMPLFIFLNCIYGKSTLSSVSIFPSSSHFLFCLSMKLLSQLYKIFPIPLISLPIDRFLICVHEQKGAVQAGVRFRIPDGVRLGVRMGVCLVFF